MAAVDGDSVICGIYAHSHKRKILLGNCARRVKVCNPQGIEE